MRGQRSLSVPTAAAGRVPGTACTLPICNFCRVHVYARAATRLRSVPRTPFLALGRVRTCYTGHVTRYILCMYGSWKLQVPSWSAPAARESRVVIRFSNGDGRDAHVSSSRTVAPAWELYSPTINQPLELVCRGVNRARGVRAAAWTWWACAMDASSSWRACRRTASACRRAGGRVW